MNRYDPSQWYGMTETGLELHRRERIEHGMSFYDWINAESFIAQVIVDTCQRFLDSGTGHPTRLTEQEWDEVLTTMRDGFQAYIDENVGVGGADEQWQEKYQAGMKLFAEYHPYLWA